MSQDIDAIFKDLYELWITSDEASNMFGIPKAKTFNDLVNLKLVLELKRLNDREEWREKATEAWIKELKDKK